MGSQTLPSLPAGNCPNCLRVRTDYEDTGIGIYDRTREKMVGFTCGRCKLFNKEIHHPPECEIPYRDYQDIVNRCASCNGKKYRWTQKKHLHKKIASRITNPRNVILITLTTKNVVTDTPASQSAILRQGMNSMMQKLTRTRLSRGKEYSWWRKNIKGWMYAFEVVESIDPLNCGLTTLNGHIHVVAERHTWFDHGDLKSQAQLAGFGPVANIRWVNPKSSGITRSIRYIVKYITKDHESSRKRRYYETGGTFRTARAPCDSSTGSEAGCADSRR